jgi:hypothetical protein
MPNGLAVTGRSRHSGRNGRPGTAPGNQECTVSRLMATTARRKTPGQRPNRGRGQGRLVLAGLGAFLAASGLLLRLYAAPRLIAAPADIHQTDILLARGASYFDQGSLTTRHDVTLTYSLTIRGDRQASTGTTGVWDSYAVLQDVKRGVQVNSTYQRAVFNRRTGQLLTCCGASVNDDTRVRQHGIGLFWPIGTRKAAYQVFDVNAASAWPAAYRGTARVQGVLTYHFVQHIPPVQVAQLAGVPSSLLGLHGKVGNVVADRYYQADNNFWVDPRTGVLIDAEQRILSVLRGPGGQGRLVVADADLKMSESSRGQLAALASKKAASIAMLQKTAPLGGGILGLILILAGTVPFRRHRRPAFGRQARRARRAAVGRK